MQDLRMLWLEITGKCQLECVHCYADSGPTRGHGPMTIDEWERVLDEAADLDVGLIQFIGGEPTLHPGLPSLIDRAVDRSVPVEVFTNLVHVTPPLWEVFAQQGVSLATSWYSDDPGEHAVITRRRTHALTKANIAEALRRSIPLRVGIVGVDDGQRITAAEEVLTAIGVTDISTDRLRQVGRGVRGRTAGAAELCGNCGDGVAAIGPDGSVWPCVFSRWCAGGNVRHEPLSQILGGAKMAATVQGLRATLPRWPCVPSMCDPQCGPNCSPACNPQCNPKGPCGPRGGCTPNYE